MKTDYQYIQFREEEKLSGYKTRWWTCLNRKHGSGLGIVHWENGWRQYVFEPCGGCIFSSGCLKDIIDFIRQAMEAHKLEKLPQNSPKV